MDAGVHGSDIHHHGRGLPFSPGFSAGEGCTAPGCRAANVCRRGRSLKHPDFGRLRGATTDLRPPGMARQASLGITESKLWNFIPVRNKSDYRAYSFSGNERKLVLPRGNRPPGAWSQDFKAPQTGRVSFCPARLASLSFLCTLHPLCFQFPYGLAPRTTGILTLASSLHLSCCFQRWPVHQSPYKRPSKCSSITILSLVTGALVNGLSSV